jgi:hypothetical protein
MRPAYTCRALALPCFFCFDVQNNDEKQLSHDRMARRSMHTPRISVHFLAAFTQECQIPKKPAMIATNFT